MGAETGRWSRGRATKAQALPLAQEPPGGGGGGGREGRGQGTWEGLFPEALPISSFFKFESQCESERGQKCTCVPEQALEGVGGKGENNQQTPC